MNSHPSRAHFRSPGSDIDEFLELLSKMFAQSHTRELKISTYAEYESTIKYFGRPILPPRLTEKEVSDMRRLKALLPTNRPNIAEGPRKSRSASVNVAHTSEVRLSAVTQDGAMRNKRSPAKATPQRLRLPRETPAASHVSGTAKSSSGANVSGILPQSPLSPKHRQRQHHPHDDATYPPAAVAVEPPHEVRVFVHTWNNTATHTHMGPHCNIHCDTCTNTDVDISPKRKHVRRHMYIHPPTKCIACLRAQRPVRDRVGVGAPGRCTPPCNCTWMPRQQRTQRPRFALRMWTLAACCGKVIWIRGPRTGSKCMHTWRSAPTCCDRGVKMHTFALLYQESVPLRLCWVVCRCDI
eukprot:m.1221672 g.1221672  ORF g.1221672 m.1221672 type:complete len:353 (-) comp24624_c0_seq35:3671-4729(-)